MTISINKLGKIVVLCNFFYICSMSSNLHSSEIVSFANAQKFYIASKLVWVESYPSRNHIKKHQFSCHMCPLELKQIKTNQICWIFAHMNVISFV